ncbi:unnamed protein product, partial [Urochloa humidicola]
VTLWLSSLSVSVLPIQSSVPPFAIRHIQQEIAASGQAFSNQIKGWPLHAGRQFSSSARRPGRRKQVDRRPAVCVAPSKQLAREGN